MSVVKGSASYKKQDGSISVSSQKSTLTWNPNTVGAAQPLYITVSTITNLQQTPASNTKVALKIFAQTPNAAAPDAYVFQFTSAANARSEQEAITDALRSAIANAKATSSTPRPGTPAAGGTPAPDNGGQPAAMAIAQAVSTGAMGSEAYYDDARLMADLNLQRSLLSANQHLRQRFDEALREKPASIPLSQFSAQFWSTRLHLLRSHAIERSQQQGFRNVLSEVKAKNVEGVIKLNLSKEQIQIIFQQHPLVKRVYNECVPGLSEVEFWQRFFVSRLFKKLKGEIITNDDPADKKLDKYLDVNEKAEYAEQSVADLHVPHFLDLEGNEANHSQRQGNKPDLTMRPAKAPILRILNNMSEKLLAHVTPVDGDRQVPAGMDEETFNELRLRDLEAEGNIRQSTLKIRDQAHLFSGSQDHSRSKQASVFAKQQPHEVLHELRKQLGATSPSAVSNASFALHDAIGVDDDTDSDDDDQPVSKTQRVGSRAVRAKAAAQVFKSLEQTLSRSEEAASSDVDTNVALQNITGLSPNVIEPLVMTHNTTTEFLHYFWSVFLSGDPERAGEVQQLVETLNKCLDRIKAVADTAEAERNAKIGEIQEQLANLQKRSGRRRDYDYSTIRGGAKVVNQMMSPTIRAIGIAMAKYKDAFEEQSANIGP